MTEQTMPVAEVTVDGDERTSYELSFHVLPTVAEGEVATVVAAIKADIAKHGGDLTDEEPAARVDLAYEVEKHLEGRNRLFKSAYFGWIRFQAETEGIPELLAELNQKPEILRHLLIVLTREEAQHPFRFHEAMAKANIVVSSLDLDETDGTDAEKNENEEEVSGEGESVESNTDAGTEVTPEDNTSAA